MREVDLALGSRGLGNGLVGMTYSGRLSIRVSKFLNDIERWQSRPLKV
jgi:hypothetical protein